MSTIRRLSGFSTEPNSLATEASVLTGPYLGVTLKDFFALSKLRLSLTVTASALVAYWFCSGAVNGSVAMLVFGLGTLLLVCGANAFNQVFESAQDKLMRRTSDRPLPAGRMKSRTAAFIATSLSSGGLLLLYGCNPLTAGLGLAAFVLYLWAYTPLKRMSPWSTAVGALSGAIPALMGWSAARGRLDPEAFILFGVVFLWQFPHTWAIGGSYAADYRRTQTRLLPLIDESGLATRILGPTIGLSLLILSLAPAWLGMAGRVYGVGAFVLGAILTYQILRFGAGRERVSAIRLLIGTLAYLPLLFLFLVLDGGVV